MMLLIDASHENAKAVLRSVPYFPDEIWKFAAMAKRFPIIDAVPVVRCKNCRHRSDGMINDSYFCNHKMLGLIRPDDFCAYGEKEDAYANEE